MLSSGFVAVVGKANSGKSTFLNSLLGEKLSIVTPKAQTTRHRVRGVLSLPEAQLIIIDTPGILNEATTPLDRKMMNNVQQAVREADAIVIVVDGSFRPKEALAAFQPGPNWSGPPVCVVINKRDLLSQQDLEELVSWYKVHCFCDKVFTASALQNEGLEEVKQWAISKLPEGPTLYPSEYISDAETRFFVAELIREQIMMQYSKDIPYLTAVQIEEYIEVPDGRDVINAIVHCEKKSHIGVLAGRQGRSIVILSAAARVAIEEWLHKKVQLSIKLKHSPKWRTVSKTVLRDITMA